MAFKCWTCGYEAEYASECPNCALKKAQEQQNKLLKDQIDQNNRIADEQRRREEEERESARYEAEQDSIPSVSAAIIKYLERSTKSKAEIKAVYQLGDALRSKLTTKWKALDDIAKEKDRTNRTNLAVGSAIGTIILAIIVHYSLSGLAWLVVEFFVIVGGFSWVYLTAAVEEDYKYRDPEWEQLKDAMSALAFFLEDEDRVYWLQNIYENSQSETLHINAISDILDSRTKCNAV